MNTFTNLMYSTQTRTSLCCRLSDNGKVYLGMRGMINTRRHGKDKVIILSYALLGGVGIGSAAYHTSIKYNAQISAPASSLEFYSLNLTLHSG